MFLSRLTMVIQTNLRSVYWSYHLLYTDVASKNAISVRGGVLKFTSVLYIDTTVHDVHSDTVVFNSCLLITRSICSYHQAQARAHSAAAQERRSTAYDTESNLINMVAVIGGAT